MKRGNSYMYGQNFGTTCKNFPEMIYTKEI